MRGHVCGIAPHGVQQAAECRVEGTAALSAPVRWGAPLPACRLCSLYRHLPATAEGPSRNEPVWLTPSGAPAPCTHLSRTAPAVPASSALLAPAGHCQRVQLCDPGQRVQGLRPAPPTEDSQGAQSSKARMQPQTPVRLCSQPAFRQKGKVRVVLGHAPALVTDRAQAGKPAC